MEYNIVGVIHESPETLKLWRKIMTENELIKAHQFCSNHKEELVNDEICGCFSCLEIFSPKEIEMWLNDSKGTAICPYCGIDSVIGESSGYSITKEFLKEMQEHWL